VAAILQNPLNIKPEFDPNVTSYEGDTVLALGSHFRVTAVLSDSDAKITMNGKPAVSGQKQEFSDLTMFGGAVPVSIAVTAQDGITVKTYTLTVNRVL
jgi:hypothetical protein